MKTTLLAIFLTALAAVAYGGSSHHHYYHGHYHPHDSSEEYHYHPRKVHVHRYHGSSASSSSSSSSEEDSHEDHDSHHKDKRVWKFQVGGNAAPFEYLNEEGILEGLSVDLLLAVCRKAGKKCAYLMDSYEHCWRNEGGKEYAGIGLLDNWYDACVGWLPSPDRKNTFNFTMAFTPTPKGHLVYRAGEDLDKNNLDGRKIGFMKGWATSQQCLKRQTGIAGHNSFEGVDFENYESMVEALLDSQIDAMLTSDLSFSENEKLESDDHDISCTSAGMSVMTHYHSEVTEWWNKAFSKLQASGEFEELCAKAKSKHGHLGKVVCI